MGHMRAKTTIKIISLVLALAAVFFAVNCEEGYATPSGNWKSHAAAKFSGGKGTKGNPYKIKDASELALLAKKVNKGVKKYQIAYYKLTSDIDLSKHYWMPIGNNSKRFYGGFYGAGHTIKGLTIKGNVKYAGLFGVIDYDASLKNPRSYVKQTRLSNVSITTKGVAGGIAGYSIHCSFGNCSISGTIKGDKSSGGVVGNALGSWFGENSINAKVSSKGYAGGIVGKWEEAESGPIENCTVKGTIKGKDYVGGIAGKVDTYIKEYGQYPSWINDKYGNYTKAIFNTKVDAKIIGRDYVGGFVGDMGWTAHLNYDSRGDNDPDVFTKIQVSGSVKGRRYVGGIFGHDTDHNLTDCHFVGSVTGKEDAGGIIGYADNRPPQSYFSLSGKISKCYVLGTVKGAKNTGGLVGRLYEERHEYVIERSFFSGTLKGTSANTGGVFGLAEIRDRNLTIKDSYVKGTIKGKANTGGLAGTLDESRLLAAALKSSYVSVSLSGAKASKGYIFGSPLNDYHTKLEDFYYNSTKAKGTPSGISLYSNNPKDYGAPKAVSNIDLMNKKLAGFNFKSTWYKRKAKGKDKFYPELKVFAKSKNKAVKTSSKKSTRTPAYYKVTYLGAGGKTSNGKTTATKYVRYNKLKKTTPPAFVRSGYKIAGIRASFPKKLPKTLKNNKVKVKVKWAKATKVSIASVRVSVIRQSDSLVKLTWQSVKGASGYVIDMSAGSSSAFIRIGDVKGQKQTSYQKGGLNWDTDYFFKVAAYTKDKAYIGKAQNTATAGVLAPSEQLGLSLDNIDAGNVRLAVLGTACNGYQILQGQSEKGAYKAIADVPQSYFVSDPYYTIQSAEIGKPYWYRVRPWRNSAASLLGRIYAKDGAAVYGTCKPSKGKITKIEQGAVSGDVKLYIRNYYCTGYDVYRKESSSPTFTKAKTILLNGQGDDRQQTEDGDITDEFAVWTDSGLSSSVTYEYYVVPYTTEYGLRVEGMTSEIKSIEVA